MEELMEAPEPKRPDLTLLPWTDDDLARMAEASPADEPAERAWQRKHMTPEDRAFTEAETEADE
jgi:hypothetical protein